MLAPPPTTIAAVTTPGTVSAYGGVQAWNDGSKLMVRRNGTIVTIPGASQADVGPGPDGLPRVAYISNHKVVVAQPDGSQARTVPNSKGAQLPTIDHDRVAWVLHDDLPIVSTNGHRKRMLQMPSTITDLELHGSTLTIIDTIDDADFIEYDTVWLENVNRPEPMVVGSISAGRSGQTLLGASWAGGKLYFYESCVVDSSGCGKDGAFRYDPKTKKYAIATSRDSLYGFAIADDGSSAFEVPGSFEDDYHHRPTVVRQTAPLTFTPRKRLGPAIP